MVKKYIIKINCTSIIELAYNGKIISKKKDIPESILEDLKKDVLDKIGININKILIICRTLRTLRTLKKPLRTLKTLLMIMTCALSMITLELRLWKRLKSRHQ